MRHASIPLAFATLLFSASGALGQDQVAALSRDAQHLADCMKALDANCVVALSHMESYERVSAPGFRFAESQSRFFDELRQTGSKYTRFEISVPRKIFGDDGHAYAFVPYVEAGEIHGRKFEQTAYLVA